jgi:hypothetical protein
MDRTTAARYRAARCQPNGSQPITPIERLRALQREYALEPDATKKQEILQQILTLIQEGWNQLFTSLSKEANPQQTLLLVAELNRIFEERKTQPAKREPPKAD